MAKKPALLAILLLGVACARAPRPRIEVEAALVRVVDGDTLDVRVTHADGAALTLELACADCRARQVEEGRTREGDEFVRLAGGVDAPDFGADETMAREASDFVRGLVEGADELGLDVDDGARGCQRHTHAGRDYYCRILAVVWVRRGASWVNVNEALVRWGREHHPQFDWLKYRRFPSEFSFEEPPAEAAALLNWEGAAEHLGETATVQGTVASTTYVADLRGQPTFIDLGRAYPETPRFTIVIWGDSRGRFPSPPEETYAGKTIRVTGRIAEYRGVPQIEADDPGDIRIVE